MDSLSSRNASCDAPRVIRYDTVSRKRPLLGLLCGWCSCFQTRNAHQRRHVPDITQLEGFRAELGLGCVDICPMPGTAICGFFEWSLGPPFVGIAPQVSSRLNLLSTRKWAVLPQFPEKFFCGQIVPTFWSHIHLWQVVSIPGPFSANSFQMGNEVGGQESPLG